MELYHWTKFRQDKILQYRQVSASQWNKAWQEVQLRNAGYLGTQYLQDAAILHSSAPCFEFQSAPDYTVCVTMFVAVSPNDNWKNNRITEPLKKPGSYFFVKYLSFDDVHF